MKYAFSTTCLIVVDVSTCNDKNQAIETPLTNAYFKYGHWIDNRGELKPEFAIDNITVTNRDTFSHSARKRQSDDFFSVEPVEKISVSDVSFVRVWARRDCCQDRYANMELNLVLSDGSKIGLTHSEDFTQNYVLATLDSGLDWVLPDNEKCGSANSDKLVSHIEVTNSPKTHIQIGEIKLFTYSPPDIATGRKILS